MVGLEVPEKRLERSGRMKKRRSGRSEVIICPIDEGGVPAPPAVPGAGRRRGVAPPNWLMRIPPGPPV